MSRRHRSYRRRILISLVTACAVVGLHGPRSSGTADAPSPDALPIVPIPVPDIGIERIEAQPAEDPIGTPVRVHLPSIGVDAAVVNVGLIEGGKMDVPADPADVGWYELGSLPGQKGNAVLDGHLDIGGEPGVFFRLDRVRPGDLIRVTDHLGAVRSFRVRETAVYDVRDAPMQKIFGDASGRHLNLITCAGTWREDMNHYDKRLVVFSDLIEE